MGKVMVDLDVSEGARKYAWDWFVYHASQRQNMFRFYIVVVAFISTATISSMGKDGLEPIVVGLPCLLILVTFLFWRLDVRSVHLIKIAEQYLRIQEKRLVESGCDEATEFCKKANHMYKMEIPIFYPFYSVRNVFSWFYISVVFISALFIVSNYDLAGN